jgi:TPR repeat protein
MKTLAGPLLILILTLIVIPNHSSATPELEDLAEWGDANAQYDLGVMYENGEGFQQDYIEAHKWYSFSEANGSKSGRNFRKIIEKLMTPEQITEAKKLARKWTKKYKKWMKVGKEWMERQKEWIENEYF